jgi:hypothetical protein
MPHKVDEWLAALETRHLAELQFSEVTRALRALSSTYVERRERLAHKSAFDSAGKRAAYALYYNPIHFLTVERIVRAIGANTPATRPVRALLDLGCGGGAAGAAWATQLADPPTVTGIDVNPWAVGEAAFTYRFFGLAADTRRGHVARFTLPRSIDALVAGWMLNEIDAASRDAALPVLLAAAERGVRVLIVEPIATRVSPWWDAWATEVIRRGGRADEWRFPVTLPDLLQRLDRAAGLRHDELKARSLYVGY